MLAVMVRLLAEVYVAVTPNRVFGGNLPRVLALPRLDPLPVGRDVLAIGQLEASREVVRDDALDL